MLKPLIELTIASVFWGFGFTATIWCLEELSVSSVLFYRFFGAFLVGSLFWFFLKPSREDLIRSFKLGFVIGFYLAFTLILQTLGLLTVSASKSAFITVTYVAIVPILCFFLDGDRLSLGHLILLITALTGAALMVGFDVSTLSWGDLLTMANAVMASFHIRAMGLVAPKTRDHFSLNLTQCFWTALFTLVLVPIEWNHSENLKSVSWSLGDVSPRVWLGLVALTLGSSLLAFYLQVRAQNKIHPSVASILFLMESPFSAFFGVWLLGERLSPLQWGGAGLIFVSCFLVSLIGRKPHSKSEVFS